MSLSKIVSVVVGAGLSLSAAALFIILYIRRKEEEEFEAQFSSFYKSTKTAKQTTKRIPVPRSALGAIIGRQGSNIKQIQAETKTRINFPNKETDEPECEAVIRGHADDVAVAELMILKIIQEEKAIETDEIFIPSEACGRIIGRNGENIRYMCRMSKAKINVDSQNRTARNTVQRVTIRGTHEQIEFVKTLISEKVGELEREQQKAMFDNTQTTSKGPKMLCIGSPDETQPYCPNLLQTEQLKSASSDGYMEVFISYAKSPAQFWAQLVQGTRSVELDKLVKEMSEYYSNQANREAHILEEVKVGDMVAAPFSYDNSWYRARVEQVEEDCYSPEERKLVLYYVDFGDNDTLTMKEVCSMDKSCLQLPLQAVECCLGGVMPVAGAWSSEAIQLFENLTYVAQWKPIMLRVIQEEFGLEDSAEPSIPKVTLIDTNGSKDVDIATELVANKYAIIDKTLQDQNNEIENQINNLLDTKTTT